MIYTFSKKNTFLKSSTTVLLLLVFMGLFTFLIEKKVGHISRYRPVPNSTKAKTDLLRQEVENKLSSTLAMKTLDPNVLGASSDLASSVPVLLYHGIVEKADGENVTQQEFIDQMFTLKANGWNTITLNEYHEFLEGKRSVPEKSFVLTFDDGRKDSYYPVDPVLEKFQFRAAIFIITGTIGNNSFHLNQEELGELTKTGRWEIATHANSGHRSIQVASNGETGKYYGNLEYRSDQNRLETLEEFSKRVSADLDSAKESVSSYGSSAKYFAFPFSDYGQHSTVGVSETLTEVAKKRFVIGFIQEEKNSYTNTYPEDFHFFVKRISIHSGMSADTVLGILNGSLEKALPYSIHEDPFCRWKTLWGETASENCGIITYALQDTTGSETILDGTRLLSDYTMKAKAILKKGQTFAILVNYIDNHNYAECQISESGISINEVHEGKSITRFKNYGRTRVAIRSELGYVVTSSSEGISCSIKNRWGGTIAWANSYSTSFSGSKGGVGYRTWDKKLNNTELIINEMEITPHVMTR